MINFIQKINKICAELCGWLLCFVMLLLLIDIVSRFLGHPVLGVAEMAMFTVMATIYLGLGNCEMRAGHVQVESLIIKLPESVQSLLSAVMYVLGIGTIVIAAYALTSNAIQSLLDMESITGLVPYPLFPVKFIMSFGLWIYLIQLIINFMFDHLGVQIPKTKD